MDFHTAAGARYLGADSTTGASRFEVEIPSDEGGHIGRQCPSCQRIFRIDASDYKALPDDLRLWCAYCGHHAKHGEFVTQQQMNRVMSVARDAGVQIVSDALNDAFAPLNRRSNRRGGVRITYKAKPFRPSALPGIDEEAVIRERRCAECDLRYSVFGEHRFCPVSGALGATAVATDALAAQTARLDAFAAIPPEQARLLREQGVYDDTYANTLGDVVAIVEKYTHDMFIAGVVGADQILRGKGNVFQRLVDLADLYQQHLGIDLRAAPSVSWDQVQRLWAARHAHVHNDGLVDDKYLIKMPTSVLLIGQRIVVTEADARLAIRQASALVDAVR